jgi:hypothetical protein
MKDYLETVWNEVGVAYSDYAYIYLQEFKKTAYRSCASLDCDSNPRRPNTKQIYKDIEVK